MAKKKPRGRPFQPGQSGNPGGRPRGLTEFRLACRGYTGEALSVLVRVMRDEKKSASARVRAVAELFDRAWGRPVEELRVAGSMLSVEANASDWPRSREQQLAVARRLAFILSTATHENERQAARRQR
jgi:hypothetical protein